MISANPTSKDLQLEVCTMQISNKKGVCQAIMRRLDACSRSVVVDKLLDLGDPSDSVVWPTVWLAKRRNIHVTRDDILCCVTLVLFYTLKNKSIRSYVLIHVKINGNVMNALPHSLVSKLFIVQTSWINILLLY